MRSGTCPWLGLAALVVLTVSCGREQPGHLVVEYDARGDVTGYVGEEKRIGLTLANVGGEMVRATRCKSSCGCQVVAVDGKTLPPTGSLELQPGQRVRLTAKVTLLEGKKKVSYRCMTTGATPMVQGAVMCIGRQYIDLRSDAVALGRLEVGQVRAFECEVKCPGDDELALSSSDAGITMAQTGSGAYLVSGRAQAVAEGPWRRRLEIVAKRRPFRRVILVTGHVPWSLELSPPSIHFGVLREGKQATRRCQVIHRAGVQVSDVYVADGNKRGKVTVKLKRGELVAVLEPGQARGLIRGVIHVRYNGGEQLVPFSGFAR